MSKTFFSYTITTPVGPVTVTSDDAAVVALDLNTPKRPDSEAPTPLLSLAGRQIGEYFNGSRLDFDLPIRPAGTAFQLRVWDALRRVPYGSTASYSDIARMIGAPSAARAVGNANNKNPIALIIPCHRIIHADGSLGGYGGGEHIKEYLLAHETAVISRRG